MFVVSVKAGKKQLIRASVVLAVAIVALIGLFGGGAMQASAGKQIVAENDAQRKSFIMQYGWQVADEPVEICEIVIPEVFNEVYVKYNDLQRSQGFDLAKYAGKRVKRWTYRITNYPEYDGDVCANILIFDGKVIGGDVSAMGEGGFVKGFAPSASDVGINTSMPNGDASSMPSTESTVSAAQ